MKIRLVVVFLFFCAVLNARLFNIYTDNFWDAKSGVFGLGFKYYEADISAIEIYKIIVSHGITDSVGMSFCLPLVGMEDSSDSIILGNIDLMLKFLLYSDMDGIFSYSILIGGMLASGGAREGEFRLVNGKRMYYYPFVTSGAEFKIGGEVSYTIIPDILRAHLNIIYANEIDEDESVVSFYFKNDHLFYGVGVESFVDLTSTQRYKADIILFKPILEFFGYYSWDASSREIHRYSVVFGIWFKYNDIRASIGYELPVIKDPIIETGRYFNSAFYINIGYKY